MIKQDRDYTKIYTISLVSITIVIGFVLIYFNVWPGTIRELEGILFFTAIIWLLLIPILTIILCVLLVKIIRRYIKDPKNTRAYMNYTIIALTVVAFIIAGCIKEIPQRTAFYLFGNSFKSLAATALSSKKESLTKKGIVGIWYVDEYRVDSRGGVYFRIGEGFDVIDRISYGFAYKPNFKGTPFGNAQYSYSRMQGDWFFFSVSDDW